MKIVRIECADGVKYGVLEGEKVLGLSDNPIENGKDAPLHKDGSEYALGDVKLLIPCVPRNFIGIGLNFTGAAKALGWEVPTYPITFFKALGSAIPGGEPIRIGSDPEKYNVLYEGEMAVVIGKQARNVSRENALDYVFGYTCCDDITNRYWFGKDDLKLKAVDTYGPLGPCVSTEVDPFNTRIRAWVNGELRQDGNSREMIFDIPYMIEHFTSFMTLYPGDVISMGTPAGAGTIHPGDVLKVEIEGVGSIENPVLDLE